MPNQNNKPPPDGGKDACHEIYKLVQKRTWFGEWCENVAIIVTIPFLLVLMPIVFAVTNREITMQLARRIRSIVFHNKDWKWWQRGFMPWCELNLMVMTYNRKKASLSSRSQSAKRVLDALSRVLQSVNGERNVDGLLKLWEESREMDADSFDSRKKEWFESRVGCPFTESARVVFECAVLLRQDDYNLLQHFCYKGCMLMNDSLRGIGRFESSLVSYYILHKDFCDRQIVCFRQTILSMARKYAENMIAFCLKHNLEQAAHLWAQVGKCVVRFQEIAPSDEGETVQREELKKFFTLFDQASAPVYVKYLQLDQQERDRPKLPVSISPANPKLPQKSLPPPKGDSRFSISDEDGVFLVGDRKSKCADYRVSSNSEAALAMKALIKDYETGTQQTRVPKKEWKGAFQRRTNSNDDASRFKKEQIFKLPKYDPVKKTWPKGQYCGRWRLYTDEEMQMTLKQRLEKFKKDHPKGIAT